MKQFTTLTFIFFFQIAAAQDKVNEKQWFVPDHLKLQFAGNIGFVSIGTGYRHGKNKLESDILLGFLPKSIGGDHITSLTLKLTYFPWSLSVNEHFMIHPFSIGSNLSYSFGSQFDTILPNEYPKGYYWWASSLRLGGFIGGEVQMELNNDHGIDRALSLYYELGTYDLKFISYIQNREYLSLDDIITLALGLRYRF